MIVFFLRWQQFELRAGITSVAGILYSVAVDSGLEYEKSNCSSDHCTFYPMAYITQSGGQYSDALGQDYVRTARAKVYHESS